ncbi:MAG: sensor domain-containing diguanylate cyclase [Firmicutes bacterium]|nr:sensor domain-containing diguanylate cyclase [[Eubacterium] siraeum]MCM1487616.1 sensor domain-containing diguanylate cyclase [Bacillota bacterium]
MKKGKALNLSLVPIYILIVVLYVISCASAVLAVIIREQDYDILYWLIPSVTAVFVLFAIGSTLFFRRLKSRFDGSFDIVLSAFSSEKTEALRSLNDGDPTPEQLSHWVSEQSRLTADARWRTSVAVAAVDNSSEIFWWLYGDKSKYYFGEYWSKTYGYNQLSASGDIRKVLSEGTLADFNGAVRKLQEGVSASFNIMGDLRLNSHKTVRVRITAKILDIEDSHGVIVGTLHNMEEEDNLIKDLESARIRENFLLRSRSDVVYKVDLPDNKLKILTPKTAKELFGFGDLPDFDGGRRPYWQMIHPDFREGFVDRFFNYNHMMMMPEHIMTYQYKIKTLEGSYIWVEHQAQVTAYHDGEVKSVIGRITNISEVKAKERDGLHQTNYDSLTGAMVFSAVKELFDKEAGSGQPKAILLFNINRFRLINNEYGYDFGNLVLRYFVCALWESQKTQCQVGRVDSDTFIVALLRADTEEIAKIQIEALFEKFNETLEVEGKMVNLTISAAASEISAESGFAQLYHQAEKALAVCKSANSPFASSYEIYNSHTEEQYTKLQ